MFARSGPAGFLQYVLYQITSLGVVDQTFNAMVDGIVGAISRAHENLQPGTISVGFGHVYNASINRSPTAYKSKLANAVNLLIKDVPLTISI